MSPSCSMRISLLLRFIFFPVSAKSSSIRFWNFVLGLDNIHAKSKIQIGTNWLQSQGYENKKILCIGDSLHDLEVAKALNADCILVSYGHFSKHRLLHHQCLVVDHLKELKDYLNL